MIEVDRPQPLPADLAHGLALAAERLGGTAVAPAVLYYPVATSTNDLAMRLGDVGYGDGTIVLAGQQTAGRGRSGHSWYSPAGAGLYLSVLLDATRTGGDWPRLLTLTAGVAVAEALHAASGLPVQIKWPNDLVVAPSGIVRGARKLAGILAEGRTDGSRLDRLVLGVGINVRSVAWPDEISARATSLEDELGRPVDPGLVLGTVVARLSTWIARLRGGESRTVIARWQQLAVGVTGAPVALESDGGALRGVTAGIDETGALLVRRAGATVPVTAGEVRWL
ncbi:MAG TPA: biotin--[acetyl-CoA-carboxylase] ligase [Vicinamibacterales bacterium]|nr:biotin--[acetyl-CoA-carboxylase] ligase [Planctomycetota bacterium]